MGQLGERAVNTGYLDEEEGYHPEQWERLVMLPGAFCGRELGGEFGTCTGPSSDDFRFYRVKLDNGDEFVFDYTEFRPLTDIEKLADITGRHSG